MGVTGQVVLQAGKDIRTIKNISGMNIRISHQIKGAADGVIRYLYAERKLKNTLLISPPGCGKTTLLRDLIRQISDGNSYGPGMTVGVVDERSEIAGSYLGIAQNDIGIRTDILDACYKKDGIFILLRAMSPEVIALDEVGDKTEWDALRLACACGCKVLATVHGEDIKDVEKRFDISKNQLESMFDLILILGKCSGKCIVKNILENS